MNPIEFQRNGYAERLNRHKESRCEIRILGYDDFIVKGVFLGVSKCKDNEIPVMGGFFVDTPIYKICIIAQGERCEPMWINTLLVDDISDIKFID